MGAQQGKENRGSSSSVGSGSHGGKTTKHKSKSKDTRVSSGAGNIFTEHSASQPGKQFNLVIDEEPLDNGCHMWSRTVGSLVVRASDSRPEGLGSMPPNTLRVHTDLHAEIVEVEIEVVSPSIVPSGNFTELNRTVTCMVLKANDRRTSCPCHDEFRGPRSDYVRQVALENNNVGSHIILLKYGCGQGLKVRKDN
ncbi:hypothetical protein TNCV_896871 [Trichonephila clavipes]|nr:hypothetical protein TNCV_896871 [Trichonephila clavipes]